MVIYPCESPQRFPHVPGTVVLIDPNRHHVGQVKPEELRDFLVSHDLCCETDLGQSPELPTRIRRVCGLSFKPILERATCLPQVRFQRHEYLTDDPGQQSPSSTRDSLAEIVCQLLATSLQKHPYVCYLGGGEELDLFGYGSKWRDWFLNDVMRKLPDVELILPPGYYPGLWGAVICRKDAPRNGTG